jgi:NitT/TauT family transport system substrate-binding protein
MSICKNFLHFAVAIVCVLEMCRSACAEDAIRLATVALDSGAQPYYAQQMGFFKKAGLNVEVSTEGQGAAIAAGVAAGSIDIGFANVGAIAAAFSKNVPITIVAPAGLYLSGTPTSVCMVPKNSPITKAADFNGKTIATGVLRGIGEWAPRAWIDKNGGDSSTVKFIEMPYSTMADALAKNRVDGIVTAEPLVAAAKDSGRVISNCYDGIGTRFLIGAFFTTPAWAQTHREAIRKFQAVMRETAIWANNNHDKTATMYAQQAKVDPAIARTMVRSPYAETLDPKELQPMIDVSARYGAIAATFPATALIFRDGGN